MIRLRIDAETLRYLAEGHCVLAMSDIGSVAILNAGGLLLGGRAGPGQGQVKTIADRLGELEFEYWDDQT